VPSDGLVAWYPFNGNAIDESGNGYNGTVVGATATIDRYGNANSALEFLGSPVPGTNRTQVAVDNHVAVENFDEGFENGIAISLWSKVYPTSESAFLQRRLNNNIDFSLELSGAQQAGVHLGFMALSSASSILNEWMHIVMSYDEQNVQLFKNGLLIAAEPATQNINSYADLLLIGKYIYYGGNTHHFFFNGKQDDIGLWNRALTEAEILSLYTAELPVSGCTDSTACNYESDATVDDESCISAGCMDELACNFDSSAGCSDDSCLPYDTVVGCMDSDACNFDATALCSDDSCVYPLVDNDCDSGASACAEGTTWNLEEQTCDAIACEPIADSSACGPGTYWDIASQQCLPIDDPSNEEGITDGDALVYVPASAADFLKGQVVGNRVFMELDCTLLLDSVALLNAALANTTADIEPDPGSNEFTCGDPVNYQGYDYATVQIGEQCWFAENLRSTQFTDGSAIPTSAVDPFGDNAANTDVWGLMYEGTAVIDSRGLCPSDWHISSNADWQQLINYAASNGFSGNESTALKSASGWSSGANGSDAFGFNAKPGGFHYNPIHPTWGEFNHSMTSGYWWTSTIQSASESIAWTLQNDYLTPSYYHSNGMSVRCLKDTEE
jgi:uncharacterized protein (TIGR02145 family)